MGLSILCDMKFVFVVGGSYKAFYLNHLSKIYNPNIIVFNQNIFYDFDIDAEKDFNGPVSNELMHLHSLFNCPIAVYGTKIVNGEKYRCFITCSNSKIKIFEQNSDIYIRVKNCYVLIGSNSYYSSKAFATITVSDNTNPPKVKQGAINNYFYCNKRGVTLFKGGKFYKKFNKCCKFILRFF